MSSLHVGRRWRASVAFWLRSKTSRTSKRLGRFLGQLWPSWRRLVRWRYVALRYRRWFRAENSGSKKLKEALDKANYALHLSRDLLDRANNGIHLAGRCLFCDLPFDHGEEVVWLPEHRRGYCLGCRDELAAAEKEEAEAEARMGPYAVRGVNPKDFYQGG